MALMHTPICEFGAKAPNFNLLGVNGKKWSLQDCRGDKGLLVMFICNHCPYVKAIQSRLIEDVLALHALSIGVVAINANDPTDYEEDSYENMQLIAERLKYPFPYLIDETQSVAKAYGAICTPDFFGYNADLELQYRGRLDESERTPSSPGAQRELVEAMRQIAQTGRGPKAQIPSMGCSIKWREE
ncbi:MAG: thioredoxin family protein [Gammaproteobacteria bacterium]